jgi:hypothetical protein
MKNKIAIIILIACFSSILGFSQNEVDTTIYYLKLENSDYKKAIEFCISDFNKWNLENYHAASIIAVKISPTEADGCVLSVSQIFTMSNIFHSLPDNYSYLNGKPILWMMGRSYLYKSDSTFRKFVIQYFSKYVLNDLVYDNSFDLDNPIKFSYKIRLRNANSVPVKKDSLPNRSQSQLTTIPADVLKNLKPTNINTTNEIINFSPVFIIKMKGNEISIDKIQRVFQESVKTR